MAMTKEALAELKAEIEAKTEGLEIDELKTVISGLIKKIAENDKSISLNYEEDAAPVDQKDIFRGLRSY